MCIFQLCCRALHVPRKRILQSREIQLMGFILAVAWSVLPLNWGYFRNSVRNSRQKYWKIANGCFDLHPHSFHCPQSISLDLTQLILRKSITFANHHLGYPLVSTGRVFSVSLESLGWGTKNPRSNTHCHFQVLPGLDYGIQ